MYLFLILCLVLMSNSNLLAMGNVTASQHLQQQQQQSSPKKTAGTPTSTGTAAKKSTTTSVASSTSGIFDFKLPDLKPSTDYRFTEGKRNFDTLNERLKRTKVGTKLHRNLLVKIALLLPDIVDNQGNTLLHDAVKQKNGDLVKLVLGHAKNLDKLHAAYPNKAPQDTLTYLNTTNQDGMTALHLAAASGQDQLGQQLVDAGIDQSIQDSQGRTAADLVADGKKQDFSYLFPTAATEATTETNEAANMLNQNVDINKVLSSF